MNNFKALTVNKDIFFSCNKKLDSRVIKEKDAGKWKNPETGRWEEKKTKYISGHTCISLLNEAFGSAWSFEVEKEWIEDGIVFFKKETDYTKFPQDKIVTNDKGEKGIYIPQNPIAWCKGVITVWLKEENTNELIQIKKTGYGSQSINGDQASQANNGFKGAQTDALKKAATLFGIGLELYRNDKEQEQFVESFDMQLDSIETTAEEEKLIAEAKEIASKFTKPHEVLSYCTNIVSTNTLSKANNLPERYLKSLIAKMKKMLLKG